MPYRRYLVVVVVLLIVVIGLTIAMAVRMFTTVPRDGGVEMPTPTTGRKPVSIQLAHDSDVDLIVRCMRTDTCNMSYGNTRQIGMSRDGVTPDVVVLFVHDSSGIRYILTWTAKGEIIPEERLFVAFDEGSLDHRILDIDVDGIVDEGQIMNAVPEYRKQGYFARNFQAKWSPDLEIPQYWQSQYSKAVADVVSLLIKK